MEIIKSGNVASPLRSSDMFTGNAFGQVLYEPPQREGGVRVNLVMFEPGARTWWHKHEAGQVIYVTAGRGAIHHETSGSAIIEPGDVIVVPAGEWHWHGAAPDTFLLHLTINPGNEGSTGWRDREVTDEEYRAEFSTTQEA
jgi:quercetin dioxygenase-like cupin family protein